jgi:hypothetical protein
MKDKELENLRTGEVSHTQSGAGKVLFRWYHDRVYDQSFQNVFSTFWNLGWNSTRLYVFTGPGHQNVKKFSSQSKYRTLVWHVEKDRKCVSIRPNQARSAVSCPLSRGHFVYFPALWFFCFFRVKGEKQGNSNKDLEKDEDECCDPGTPFDSKGVLWSRWLRQCLQVESLLLTKFTICFQSLSSCWVRSDRFGRMSRLFGSIEAQKENLDNNRTAEQHLTSQSVKQQMDPARNQKSYFNKSCSAAKMCCNGLQKTKKDRSRVCAWQCPNSVWYTILPTL